MTTVVSCIEPCKTMIICVRRTNVIATPGHTAATLVTTVVLPASGTCVVEGSEILLLLG